MQADEQKDGTNFCFRLSYRLIKVPIAPNYEGVCLQMQVNLIHTILKYGDYYDFMDR